MFRKILQIIAGIWRFLNKKITLKQTIKIFLQIIIRIWKFLKRELTLRRVALAVNIGVAIGILFLAFTIFEMVRDLDDKTEIYQAYFKREFGVLTTTIIKLGTLAIENDLSQLELTKGIMGVTKGIQDNISKMRNIQKILEKRLTLTKLIKIENIENIKKANFEIINMTKGYAGSGSHIKILNKSYVLTCAHLLHNKENKIWALINKKMIPLELIKINTKTDLALFRIPTSMKNFPHLEVSNEYPTEGSEIIVIGNTSGLEDVITDGVIAREKENHYVFTNKVFYGNSGGALLYKEKIVGITSYVQPLYKFPVFVNYGMAIKLKRIKEFLKDIK